MKRGGTVSIYMILNGVFLTGCAFFIADSQQWLITALLLFLPLLDKNWFLSRSFVFSNVYKAPFYIWIIIVLSFVVLLLLNKNYELITLNIILFTALPEEWFFRAYFLRQLNKVIEGQWFANGITSLLFALLHVPTQGVMGLSVFFPSLVFGYVYLRTGNLLLVIMLHALSNLIYVLYLRDILNRH